MATRGIDTGFDYLLTRTGRTAFIESSPNVSFRNFSPVATESFRNFVPLADINEDGKLSPTELTLSSASANENTSILLFNLSQALQRRWRAIDRNGDGFLTYGYPAEVAGVTVVSNEIADFARNAGLGSMIEFLDFQPPSSSNQSFSTNTDNSTNYYEEDTVVASAPLEEPPVQASPAASAAPISAAAPVSAPAPSVPSQDPYMVRMNHFYRNLLGRDVDADTFAKGSKLSTATIVKAIVNSNEYRQLGKSPEQIARDLYRTLLVREADGPGLQVVTDAIAKGRINEVIDTMINSAEYRARPV